MATLTNYQSYKLGAYALVYFDPNDPVELDVTGFTFTYAKNAIPNGTMTLAVGRRVLDGVISEIHRYINEVRTTIPVEIYLSVAAGSNSFGFDFEIWPEGYFRVFRGLINNIGFSSSRDNIAFEISFEHWLSDLNASSAFTSNSHTLTPQQFGAMAAVAMGGQGGGGFFPVDQGAAEFFGIDNISADFWGLSLSQFLAHRCQMPILDEIEGGNLPPNIAGLAALRSFEPAVYADQNNPLGFYTFGVPLSIPNNGSAIVASAFAEAFMREGLEAYRDSTLWEKLMSYKDSYELSIIPLTDSALIVPSTDGQRFPWQTIYGEEYSTLQASTQSRRPLRGIRLFSGFGSLNGAAQDRNGQNPQAAAQAVLCGRYDNPNLVDGMLRYDMAPSWAGNIANAGIFGGQAVAPFGVRGDMRFPGAGIPPAVAPQDIVEDTRDLWNAYAKSVYIREYLRGRTATLHGKLRFDIAPGSTVEILCVEDKFVQLAGGLADTWMYAEVAAVTVTVDAERMQASTSFRLSNLRTLAENTDDAISVTTHPFYNTAWAGAPLIETAEFLPQPNPVFNQ